MSDTPTTAELRATIANIIGAADWGDRLDDEELITTDDIAGYDATPQTVLSTYIDAADAVIAYLRSSPAALADLNGGEWVQPESNGRMPWWQDMSDDDPGGGGNWFVVNAPDAPERPDDVLPLFIFVPREDR